MVWSPADLLWSLTNRAQLTVFESICANLFLALIASLGITPAYDLIRGSQFKPKGKVLFDTAKSKGLVLFKSNFQRVNVVLGGQSNSRFFLDF